MSEKVACVAVSGFGLRVVSTATRFRAGVAGEDGELELCEADGSRTWRVAARELSGPTQLEALRTHLVGVAHVEAGPSTPTWKIDAARCCFAWPQGWSLEASAAVASVGAQLLGPDGASILVRTYRRMPALEALQGAGQRFRDIGQLERAGWMEFEHEHEGRTWVDRHEMLHRGTTPFVVTLRAAQERLDACIAALALVVQSLEAP